MQHTQAFARGVVFRQLLCSTSFTFTYIVGCAKSRQAVLLDSVLGNVERDLALARELDLNIAVALETHVHADHITAAATVRQRVGCDIAVPELSGATGAQRLLKDGDVVRVGANVELRCIATPGHTPGCMSYYCEQLGCVFTGDALLIRGCGRADFQGGSAEVLWKSIRERLFALPDETVVFVGHDYRGLSATTIGEEKAHNRRVGGDVSLNDFNIYMRNLSLPHPNKIAEAVPANLVCGASSVPVAVSWDPDHVRPAVAGHLEMDPSYLEEHLEDGSLTIVDLRTPEELADPRLGQLPHSVRVALDDVLSQDGKSSPLAGSSKPIAFVCRAGARSAQACVLLMRADKTARCASLPGGMIRWNREHRRVLGGLQ